jgi:acyl-CoA thioesterase
MRTFKNVEEAREYFKNDLFAYNADVFIEEIGEDYCKCSMKLSDKHRNAIGGVMGGAIFTLADLAVSAIANDIHSPTVSQQVSTNFMSMAKGDTLIAIAKCKKDGRTSCVYNVDVCDNLGREIAQAVFTGYKL